MNRIELDADTRATAVRLLANGTDPEKVIEFIYQAGRMAGLMDAAEVMTGRVVQAQRQAA